MAPSSQFAPAVDDILVRLEGDDPNQPLALEDRKAVERIAGMGGHAARRAEQLLALHDAANGYGSAYGSAPSPVRVSGVRERVAGAVKRGKAAVDRSAVAIEASPGA